MADLPDFGTPESSGTFTVSVEDAARKLGRHQLAHPGLGVLKLVQAGVAWGGQGLSISQGLRSTRLSWKVVDHRWQQDPDFLIGYNTLSYCARVSLTPTSVLVNSKLDLELWRITFPITLNGVYRRSRWPVDAVWNVESEDGFRIYLTVNKDTLAYPRKRGILLEPMHVHVPPGLTLVFPADDMPVDLSQFRLVRGPEWELLRVGLGPRLRAAMDRATMDEQTFNLLLDKECSPLAGGLGLVASVGGVGLGCVLGFTSSFPQGLMLIALCGQGVYHSWRSLAARAELRVERANQLREEWGLRPLPQARD